MTRCTPERFLFLTGPMGSGKTFLGESLAVVLDLPFYDTDNWIVNRTGKNISSIFREEGESRFRDLETEVLQEIVQTQPPGVMATGGGLVLRPLNRQMMRVHGTIFLLYRTPAQLIRLLSGEPDHRPLLDTPDWKNRVIEIYRNRLPAYLQCHHIVKLPDDRQAAVAILTAVAGAAGF